MKITIFGKERMRIILILFVIFISFADNNFAQSKKKLEQKAQKYIDDILLDGSTRYFLEREFWLLPEEWHWKGYREPICMDSLICTNRQMKRWMKELLHPYDTLTLIERERQFPVVRIDSIDGKIIVCKFCVKSKDGIDAFHEWVYGNSDNRGGFISTRYSYIEGYWWVNHKSVLVLGNAVDLFFKRYKDQQMGDPLPPHKTIDDMGEFSQDYVDNRYWVYNNGKFKKCYFLHKEEVKEGEYTYAVMVSNNESHLRRVRESFKSNGL